jgi:hypothetical protein
VHPNLTIQSIIKRFESFKREIEKEKMIKIKKTDFFSKTRKCTLNQSIVKKDFSGGCVGGLFTTIISF